MHDDYDPVAAAYREHFADELDAKPFDTIMLDWLSARVGDRGPICDLGCGPGQVAGYLAAKGAPVCGIDLSAAMVQQARDLHPGITFEQGDMRSLDRVADASFGGVAAFYAIVNIAPAEHVMAFRELHRVLRPRGTLLLSFHVGDEVRHLDELLGHHVQLDFFFVRSADVRSALESASFTVTEVIEREPYPTEHPSRHAYLFARRD